MNFFESLGLRTELLVLSNIFLFFVFVLFRGSDATCLTDITNVSKDKVQIGTKLLTGAAAELSIDSRLG